MQGTTTDGSRLTHYDPDFSLVPPAGLYYSQDVQQGYLQIPYYFALYEGDNIPMDISVISGPSEGLGWEGTILNFKQGLRQGVEIMGAGLDITQEGYMTTSNGLRMYAIEANVIDSLTGRTYAQTHIYLDEGEDYMLAFAFSTSAGYEGYVTDYQNMLDSVIVY